MALKVLNWDLCLRVGIRAPCFEGVLMIRTCLSHALNSAAKHSLTVAQFLQAGALEVVLQGCP